MKLDLILTMANIIADKYDMIAVVNYKMGTVNFVGDHGREVEEKCARELADVFGDCIVEAS